MRNNLRSWQWSGYAANHVTRSNLVVHVITVPVFIGGIATIVASPFIGLGWLPVGVGAMAIALVAQGRGHRGEPVSPVPFTGPGDFVSRLLVEQLITFPRFFLSGGWLRAWRGVTSRTTA